MITWLTGAPLKQWKFFIHLFCWMGLGQMTCWAANPEGGIPLFYWQQKEFVNFGDYLSLKLVERIVEAPVRVIEERALAKSKEKKLLAIGSILSFARENDVVWGSGINGKLPNKNHYLFCNLDVRAVRGPLTREFLIKNFHIPCPEVYGDPALLIPYFFPEFKRKKHPSRDYIIIPHYSEKNHLPTKWINQIVYPTDPWDQVIKHILDSQFVISSSLHGIIVAEAFGVPARLLRLTENEPIFKYQDYYLGTGRPHFQFATSIEEALKMGGEDPPTCNLEKLYESFPFEFWPTTSFKILKFPTETR